MFGFFLKFEIHCLNSEYHILNMVRNITDSYNCHPTDYQVSQPGLISSIDLARLS